ncbi:MAG: hypothetical protein JXM70_02235 [Pirellulales bacterium]|nr:hypothetical protein [Pirellulales bacterium]
MTPKQRIEAVYRGCTPDQVPFMLDLSHWFYHKNRLPWDLSRSYDKPEYELIDYHKRQGVGFYMPNLGSFYTVSDPEDVVTTVTKSEDGRTITWSHQTPGGTIRRSRVWEEATYAWGVSEWGVKSEEDLKILADALERRTFSPLWDRYEDWVDAVGDMGVVYVGIGYSGMGQLLNYWLGVEGVMYAAMDWPETMRDTVDRINASNLNCIDMLVDSPVEFVVMGDNFSSDVQPPHFFKQWSADYYREAIRRLHKAGKFVAVHIDGKLKGALQMIRDVGADCADAVTPRPMGDLSPQQCRNEAGDEFILSGGVSPNLWLPDSDLELFKQAALEWIALKDRGPRLIANAGDQVPPLADEDRIAIYRDLVDEHGY